MLKLENTFVNEKMYFLRLDMLKNNKHIVTLKKKTQPSSTCTYIHTYLSHLLKV